MATAKAELIWQAGCERKASLTTAYRSTAPGFELTTQTYKLHSDPSGAYMLDPQNRHGQGATWPPHADP